MSVGGIMVEKIHSPRKLCTLREKILCIATEDIRRKAGLTSQIAEDHQARHGFVIVLVSGEDRRLRFANLGTSRRTSRTTRCWYQVHGQAIIQC